MDENDTMTIYEETDLVIADSTEDETIPFADEPEFQPPPRRCLICTEPLDDAAERLDQHPGAVLALLAKILKISPSIYDGLDIGSLAGPIYCVNCNSTLQEGMQVIREMKRLECVLESLQKGVKSLISNTFASESIDYDTLSPHHSTLHRIRKTLAQCKYKIMPLPTYFFVLIGYSLRDVVMELDFCQAGQILRSP